VYSKFQQFSTRAENRLIPSYLQFNYLMCSQTQHRNIFAVLPGMDTTDKSLVIIEGHIDSRCAGACDTACLAEGMEDNGSGTALVMELARVMSKYSYNQTIVFLVVIGEEQGLYGAKAFADYAKQKGIKIKPCLITM
jgi:Zn-dependent M28 family amino/carboxypeptidase